MSDIESRIEGWRRSLFAREGMRVEHADELEDHLREEITRLRGATLSDDEVFLVATHRLGGADALAAQFEQADPRSAWRRRWIWMLAGYLGINLALRVDLIVARFAELAPSSRGVGDGLFPIVFLLGLGSMIAFAWWTGRPGRGSDMSARGAAKLRSQRLIVTWAILGGLILSFAPLLGRWTTWTVDGMGIVTSRSVFLWLLQLFFWLAPTILLVFLVVRDRKEAADRDATLAAES